MKSVHQHFRLHSAHLAGLDDDRASGSDCRRHFDRDRAGARIPWRKYAHHAGRLHHDLRCADSFDQIEIFEDFLEVQENVRREVVGALRTVLRCAVFHDRRLNELIHSLGHGVVQPLQELHPVFLATLRKGVEGLFRSTDGFSRVDFVCHGDLADNLVVGRVHKIDDLGSMGSDELTVDVGAIKSFYWSRGCLSVHLSHLYDVQL